MYNYEIIKIVQIILRIYIFLMEMCAFEILLTYINRSIIYKTKNVLNYVTDFIKHSYPITLHTLFYVHYTILTNNKILYTFFSYCHGNDYFCYK